MSVVGVFTGVVIVVGVVVIGVGGGVVVARVVVVEVWGVVDVM